MRTQCRSWVIHVIRAYGQLLEDRSYLDYSSILEAAVDVLTNDDGLRERLKAGRPHRVPLSDRAVKLLKGVPREDGNCVFIGPRKGSLSDMAMLELLRGMRPGFTVHGFRSSFRDWAAVRTNYPREVAELALAHSNRDKVEAAYLRDDMIDKRRQLMGEWAAYYRHLLSILMPLETSYLKP